MGNVQMDMKEYVVSLLENYNGMNQEIESLHFELENLKRTDDRETIEAMNFSFPTGERITSGNISDKTSDIALTYVQKHEEFKAKAFFEITARLRFLNETIGRLNFYIGKLDAYQASILREYYFEGYTWRELQDLRGVTYKTLIKHRNEAVKILTAYYSSVERVGLL